MPRRPAPEARCARKLQSSCQLPRPDEVILSRIMKEKDRANSMQSKSMSIGAPQELFRGQQHMYQVSASSRIVIATTSTDLTYQVNPTNIFYTRDATPSPRFVGPRRRIIQRRRIVPRVGMIILLVLLGFALGLWVLGVTSLDKFYLAQALMDLEFNDDDLTV